MNHVQRIAHVKRIGASVEGDAAQVAPVFDPASGRQTGEVVLASATDVDRAVAGSQAAWVGWRDTSLTARTRILFAFRQLADRHREDLARLITAEHGKVLEDARGEVARGIEVIEFACGIPHLLKGEFSEDVSTGVDASSIRQPLGVVAGITPFNFPVMVPMWMYPVAIACGNTFILKPSERDPSPSALIAELWREAGLPEGVFTVVNGDAVAVDALLDHPGVAAVSFVGSTPVARHVFERATGSGKRCQSLGGAKNHAVVMPDADLDAAADALIAAGYGSAGERCMAISAVVAVGDGDALVRALAERAPSCGPDRGPTPARTWARSSPRPTGTGWPGTWRRPRPKGPRWWWTAGTSRCDGWRRWLLPRAQPGRPGHAVHAGLPGRDLRAGPVGDPGRRPRRSHRPGQRQPLRQRHGHLHPGRVRRPALPT